MKNKLIATLIATGMAVTTGAAFAGENCPKGGFGKHGGMHARMYKNLDLTKQQDQQIKEILEKARPNKAEHRGNRQAHFQAKHQLIQSANLDEDKLNQLAEQTAEQVKQRFIKRVKTQHQIWQILTPEQRQKVIERQNKHMEKRGKHGQHNGKSS